MTDSLDSPHGRDSIFNVQVSLYSDGDTFVKWKFVLSEYLGGVDVSMSH